MKLRNKKTGEVQDSEKLFSCYESLKELSEYWEDYTPKQPIIKDEKIRRALRTWAEVLELDEVYIRRNSSVYEICPLKGVPYTEQFKIETPCYGEDFGSDNYTIAELCGEEE